MKIGDKVMVLVELLKTSEGSVARITDVKGNFIQLQSDHGYYYWLHRGDVVKI